MGEPQLSPSEEQFLIRVTHRRPLWRNLERASVRCSLSYQRCSPSTPSCPPASSPLGTPCPSELLQPCASSWNVDTSLPSRLSSLPTISTPMSRWPKECFTCRPPWVFHKPVWR